MWKLIFLFFFIKKSFEFSYFEKSQNEYIDYEKELNDLYINTINLENYNYHLDLDMIFLINPCNKFSSFTICKENLLELEKNKIDQQFIIFSEKPVIIYFKISKYSYSCSDEFMIKDNCGVFFEIHKPIDETVLYSEKIREIIPPEKNNFIFFNLDKFCTGEYEIWYIIKSRNKKFISFIKPFFLLGNCDLNN